jgi:uncharacterized protein
VRQVQIQHFFIYDNTTYCFDSNSLSVQRIEKKEANHNLKTNHHPTLPQLNDNNKLKVNVKCNQPEKLNPIITSTHVEILINATQECNLTCNYCFVDKGKFSYGEDRVKSLLPQTIETLIEKLPKELPWATQFCIHFYGGEPLLNTEALETAVKLALKTKNMFSFAITTNGTLDDKSRINLLTKGHFNIVLSIDGPAGVHDTYRRDKEGQPTHLKVINFLSKVKRAGLFVRGSSVVRHAWSLKEACAYLKTLPVDAIKAQAVRLPVTDPLALNERERTDYIGHLKEIGDETIVAINQGVYPKDDRFVSRVLQLLCKTRRDSFCGAGTRTFGMAADGTMLPCVLLAGKNELCLGNINESSNWVEKGQRWAENNNKASKKCLDCWALPLCGGGCPAMLSVCGDDECQLVQANCEVALYIFAAFFDNPQKILQMVVGA